MCLPWLFSLGWCKVVRLSNVEFYLMGRAPLRRYHCCGVCACFGFVDEGRESFWDVYIFRVTPSRNAAIYLAEYQPHLISP